MTAANDFHRAWSTLPVGGLDAVIGSGTCVVLAPHADDESLGCGGLIAACCAAGRPPLVAILTDGTGSHPRSRAYPAQRLRAVREQEARAAVGYLGLPADHLAFLDQRDTAAPHEGPAFAAVVDSLAALAQRGDRCTAILAPWRFDPHCDHEAASKAADVVAKRCGIRHLAYPVWGWTLPYDQTIPARVGGGWRLDIAAFLPRKQGAIRSHVSQYGGLITDDPTGFVLPPGLLSVFETDFETFIQP